MRRWMSIAAVGAAFAASLLTALGPADPTAAAPPGFTDTLVVGGLAEPTAVEPMPDGRLLVLQKGGQVRVVQPNGAIVTAATLPVCSDNEMGLLSIALDPDFAANGHVYVFRTRPGSGGGCSQSSRAEALSRFTMSGNSIDLGSEVVLIDNVPAWGGNHNGGTVEVGNDGLLYLGIGDSGSDPRPGGPAAAQDLSLLNGKVVRMTTSGAPAPGNPLLGDPNAAPCATSGLAAPTSRVCSEIFAWGLRNPYRMAFDTNTGATRFRINDVGQNTWEEIDDGVAGANYGWPAREGRCVTGSASNCTPDPTLTEPVASYQHASGCEFITAGAFVPDGWWPAAYDGGYLFADGGCGNVWLLDRNGAVDIANPFTSTSGTPADMAFGVRNGEQALFYVTVGGGQLRKVVYAAPPADPGPLHYVPYPAPQRVYDTRNDIGTPPAEFRGGTSRRIALGVPGGARAVLANVTLEGAKASNFLVAWQPGTARPATSSANVGAGEVAANAAVLPVDAQGRVLVDVFSTGNVVIDVLGSYQPAPGAVASGRFIPLTPARLLDTRQPSGGSNVYTQAANADGSTVTVDVAGRFGIPGDATTVALTVTALSAANGPSGYVTAYPGGGAVPPHSTVNVNGALDRRANLVVIPVGADGSVDLLLFGVEDVVVDVAGWITGASDAAASAGRLHVIPLARIADSRTNVGLGTLPVNGSATLDSPVIPPNGAGVVQNVTMANTAAAGWICATPNPYGGGDVSIQNASASGQDRPALVFSQLGTIPGARLRYCTYERTDLIVDITGWFE